MSLGIFLLSFDSSSLIHESAITKAKFYAIWNIPQLTVGTIDATRTGKLLDKYKPVYDESFDSISLGYRSCWHGLS